VHPTVMKLYEENSLNRYFQQLDDIEVTDGQADLTVDEKVLMKILKALH
jgi:DNA topoisomerase-1